MCGFFCIVGKDQKRIITKKEISNVGLQYIHRGPDSQDYYFENDFKCFFRRLSIIDLHQRSDQPYHSTSKRYVLLFNGEIYNFKIIRSELRNLGYSFYTEGDTEIVMKAFEVWGKDFVKKLRGMFSICIWDKRDKKFYAFRDRIGIKPLYFTCYKNTYFFSSEIKDLISLLKIKKFKENSKVISNYLANSFLNDTNETFFKEIFSVKPGHMIEIVKSKMKSYKYWSLKYSDSNTLNKNDVRDSFNEALNLHTISDVPIAYTLSGGIDSGLLAGASVKLKNFNKDTKFFSINPNYSTDESKWINSTVKKYNLNHYYLKINHKKSQDFKEYINFQDEPVQTASAYYQYLLRKKIKEYGLKVLMVGEGADEVFGGYKRCLFYYLYSMNFKKNKSKNFISNAVSFMQQDEQNIILNYNKFKNIIDGNKSDIENKTSRFFLKDKKVKNQFLEVPKNSKFFFKDALISHLTKRDLPYVLRMEDKNSMSQGIEARVPFLDHELIEFVFKIKTKHFMDESENKHILRSSFKNYFSNKVLNRKDKSARPGNNAYFIFNNFYENFLDLLSSKNENQFFDQSKIKINFEKDKKLKNNENADFYFRAFNFLSWKDNFNI